MIEVSKRIHKNRNGACIKYFQNHLLIIIGTIRLHIIRKALAFELKVLFFQKLYLQLEEKDL